MTRPLTLARLVRRQLATDVGGVLALAVTTLVVTALLAAWPRTVDDIVARDLAENVAALPTSTRDLVPDLPVVEWFDGVASQQQLDTLLAEADAQDEALLDGLGPTLRAVVHPTEHVVAAPPLPIELGPRDTPFSSLVLEVLHDPLRAERVEIVEGRPPAPVTDPGAAAVEVEVMLSTAVAEEIGWRVGETRAALADRATLTARLTGTFAPLDPAASVWTHAGPLLAPLREGSESAGWSVTVAGHVDPSVLRVPSLAYPAAVERWVPVDPGAVGRADAARLVADLDRARTTLWLRSETRDVVEGSHARSTAVTAVLGVVTTGALGAAVAVLWLGSVLVAQRRGTALVLLRARGTSALPALVAAQTLVATLPAGAVGTLVGLRVVPGPVRPGDVVAPAVLTVLTAVLAAVAAWRRSTLTSTRHTGRWRWRWVVEVLAVLAASAATALVVQGDAVDDPALTALPVLLAVAVAALGLRLHPLLLAPVRRPARRQRRLGPFLTLAQLSGAVTAVPVVVLVVAAGTVGLMSTVLSGVDAGTEERAVRAVGADLRIEVELSSAAAAPLTDADTAAVADVPGVRAVAAVRDGGRATLRTDTQDDVVSVVVVDAGDLAAVQTALPPGVRSPSTTDADAVRVVVPRGADVPAGAAVVLGRGSGPTPVEGTALVGELPGVTSGSAWVLVDETAWARASGDPVGRVDALLVGLAPGADPAGVARAASAALDGRVTVGSLAERLEHARSGAATAGLRGTLLAVGVVTVALASLGLALALLTAAPARARTSGVLAGLGAPPVVRRRLVVAESLGLLAAALPAAATAAVLLPLLVLRVVDLRLFTGTRAPVATTLDPVLVAGLAALGLGLGGAAVLVAVVSARRAAGTAGPLREGGA